MGKRDSPISSREICISLEEIHKSDRKIGISLREIGKSKREIPISPADLCISPNHATTRKPVFSSSSPKCPKEPEA